MEDALFSNDIFRQDVEDGIHEDADDLNEETFGLADDDDDLFQPNDDWEKQHQVISKIIEGGSHRNSPLKYKSQETEIPAPRNGAALSPIERPRDRHNVSLSDAEEEMIETTINSLGLDDESNYEVKHTPTKAMSFEESHLSWNSPIRGKEHRSDSLQELISPGDGVWASPSRDVIWTPPSREGIWPPGHEGSLWSSPARGSDNLKPSPLRLDDISATELHEHHQYNGNIVRKLITSNEESDLENNAAVLPQPVTPSSPSIQNHSMLPSPTPVMSAMPTTPVMSAIRVEDLERELKKSGEGQQQTGNSNQPTIIERHHMTSPAVSMMKSPIPYPMFSPKELHMKTMLAGLSPTTPTMDINAMTSLLINQQMMANYSHMMNAAAAGGGPPGPPPPSPLLPPPPGHPLISPYQQRPISPRYRDPAEMQRYQKVENAYHKTWQTRRGELGRVSEYDRQYPKHVWHKELHPSKFKEIDYEQFIQMEPSAMMNAKEKKWIFKISLMSLLNGDPHTSDYYFITHVTSRASNKQEDPKKNKEIRKKLEKTNQLMTYVQQQQDTKESHRPVKFKGSLGKLSITSVHHPRQIMDFSTHESEGAGASEECGKKKFLIYGAVEKMYSLLLIIMDMERELNSKESKEQTDVVESRLEKIREMFALFRLQADNGDGSIPKDQSDLSHFTNLMSVSKGRKLMTRVFLLFSQEQSEALFLALITVLPALLKKDKEESILHLGPKLDVMLRKSEKHYRLKCIQLLRKVELKILLMYSTSVLILATLLDLLEEKNRLLSLEWTYYLEEVPKILPTLPKPPPNIQVQLDNLKVVLGLDSPPGVNNVVS